MSRPYPGDVVYMPFDSSVTIEITQVLKQLTNDTWVICDQYGDEHTVEAEGDHWITIQE
jgi:hypothetical protein